jgi:hypothetical protein
MGLNASRPVAIKTARHSLCLALSDGVVRSCEAERPEIGKALEDGADRAAGLPRDLARRRHPRISEKQFQIGLDNGQPGRLRSAARLKFAESNDARRWSRCLSARFIIAGLLVFTCRMRRGAFLECPVGQLNFRADDGASPLQRRARLVVTREAISPESLPS